jgi:hypothetical protein
LRAAALEEKGYVRVVRELADLPALLREKMNSPYPAVLPDLNGAARSRGLLAGLWGI